jgi:hypothetical protein
MIEWKAIKDYEGLYEVSNDGQIRRISYEKRCHNLRYELPKILNTYKDKNSYNVIRLYKNGIVSNLRIGRLVGLSFVKGYKENYQINHVNGNKADDNYKNLEWVTASENIIHKFEKLGVCNKNNAKSKIVKQYDLNGNLLKVYPSTHEVSRQTGFSQSMVAACCRGEIKTLRSFIWKYETSTAILKGSTPK